MFIYQCFTLFFIGAVYFPEVKSQNDNIVVPDIEVNVLDKFSGTEKVDVKLYYECLCPGSRAFTSYSFTPAIVQLNGYLDVNIYPYGFAKTTEKDGHYEFKCQHGPAECYGNKLHACAIDILNNITQALIYNSCMMEEERSGEGSDDSAADQCGQMLNINSEPIKSCAKGDKGSQLLKQYGDESKKVNFQYVPYVLLNGTELSDHENFINSLCAAFTSPPPPCKDVNNVVKKHSANLYRRSGDNMV